MIKGMSAQRKKTIWIFVVACTFMLSLFMAIKATSAHAGLGAPTKVGEETNIVEKETTAKSEVEPGDPWTIDSDCSYCHPAESDFIDQSTDSTPAPSTGMGLAAPTRLTESPSENEVEEGNSAAEESEQASNAETDREQSDSKEPSPLLAAVHDNEHETTCTTCHIESDMSSIHNGMTVDSMNLPTRKLSYLSKSEVSDETCLACHDLNEIVGITADSTLLTDANGLVVNPHAYPATETHGEEISCVSCHRMHNEKTGEERAFNTCSKCHHKNVWECNTCHSIS